MSQTKARVGLVAALVGAVLAIVLFGMTYASVEINARFCTAEGRIGAPEGWVWGRGENCEWTLYSNTGNPAPDEVYETYGLIPPPSPPNVAFGAGLTLVAVAGAVWVTIQFIRTRDERASEARPSNHVF